MYVRMHMHVYVHSSDMRSNDVFTEDSAYRFSYSLDMSSKIMYITFNHICIPLLHVCQYIILIRTILIFYIVMVSHLFNCILLIIVYSLPICYSYIILLTDFKLWKENLKEIINYQKSQIKSQGSSRIGHHCIAQVSVTVDNATGKVSVNLV